MAEHVVIERAALYVRVSTDRQTVENQVAALSKVAEAKGWQIVETSMMLVLAVQRDARIDPPSIRC
jgi:predicted site-specific integrase-resolvase